MDNAKSKTGTIDILVERYAYPRESKRFTIPARIVGDLAVHRPYSWCDGEEGNERKGWTVSHLASGLSVSTALPHHFPSEQHRKRADLIAWATAWQEAAPEFFAALRAMVGDALAKARTCN